MKKLTLLFCLSIFLVACHKEKDDPGSPDNEMKKLPGSIYYKWADEGIFVIDLPSASRSLLLPDRVQRNDWDISVDNKYVLESSDVQGDYQASQFTLSNISDGAILK